MRLDEAKQILNDNDYLVEQSIDNKTKELLGQISAELSDLSYSMNGFYKKICGDEYHEPETDEFTTDEFIAFYKKLKEIEDLMLNPAFNKYL